MLNGWSAVDEATPEIHIFSSPNSFAVLTRHHYQYMSLCCLLSCVVKGSLYFVLFPDKN